MKIRISLAMSMLCLTAFALPTFAHDNDEGNECATKAAKITDSHKKVTFLSTCLKNINPTAFQFGEKVEQCIQNAKNMKLEGQKSDEYLEHCYLEDDTHPDQSQKPHPKM